jgi:dGTPase
MRVDDLQGRWERLLTDRRVHQGARSGTDLRSEFERDYDRLIFASPFRRLQDKAQVFPLESHDSVRTRLTHSLEVSTLGRSLGRAVASRLRQERGIELSSEDVGTIVATTCLAHDIGNPPFGHSGEEAIRRWFEVHPHVLEGLTPAQQGDFLRFDGNAQGLRILLFLQSLSGRNGLNLTHPTLAAFMKYVVASDAIDKKSKIRSKIGFFQSERAQVEEVWTALDLHGRRHPLAFLMEAADDIAYSVVDIEDGLKKQVLRHDQLIEMLRDLLDGSPRLLTLVDKFADGCTRHRDRPLSERVSAAIQWFRIDAIGIMFQAVVEAFVTHHDAILEGSFEQELIRVSGDAWQLWSALTEVGRREVYTASDVLALEVFGDRVIFELLSRFVPACLAESRGRPKTLEGKLFALISPSLRGLHARYGEPGRYGQLQLAVDYISGMTDTYAVAVYRKLFGRAPDA